MVCLKYVIYITINKFSYKHVKIINVNLFFKNAMYIKCLYCILYEKRAYLVYYILIAPGLYQGLDNTKAC